MPSGFVWPDRVARDLLRGVHRRRAAAYMPWPWRFVMLAVRPYPARVVARLDPPRSHAG